MSNANFRTTTTDIWARPTWRSLNIAVQHLYLLLWTHPSLTTAGTMDYHPTRLATLADDLTSQGAETALDGLVAAELAVVDRDTQELALLGWWRDSTVLKQPYMTKHAIGVLNQTASTHLLAAVASTLDEIRTTAPTLNGLQTPEAQRFLEANVTKKTPKKSPQRTVRQSEPGRLWVGHPDLVSDASEVRCRIHAGHSAAPSWCGVCRELARGV